jgi:hypothetical protein
MSDTWKKHLTLVNCCTDDGYGDSFVRKHNDSKYDHVRRWTDVIAARLDSIIIDDLTRTNDALGQQDEAFLLDDALGTAATKLEGIKHLLDSLRTELKH